MQLKSSINRNPLSNSHLKSISMSYFVKLFSGKYRRFFLSNYDFKQKFLPSFCSLTFAQNSSASPPPPSAQHSASCAVPLPLPSIRHVSGHSFSNAPYPLLFSLLPTSTVSTGEWLLPVVPFVPASSIST